MLSATPLAWARWCVPTLYNSDVQRRRQHGRAVAAGSLADHAVEYLDDVGALLVGEVGDEHAGDRVAAEAPVPQLLSGPHGDAFAVARVNGDVPQACVDQPLPQDVRVGDLELKQWLVLRRSFEFGDYCLRRTDEYVQGLELSRVPIGDEEHAPAWFVTRAISCSACA